MVRVSSPCSRPAPIYLSITLPNLYFYHPVIAQFGRVRKTRHFLVSFYEVPRDFRGVCVRTVMRKYVLLYSDYIIVTTVVSRSFFLPPSRPRPFPPFLKIRRNPFCLLLVRLVQVSCEAPPFTCLWDWIGAPKRLAVENTPDPLDHGLFPHTIQCSRAMKCLVGK